MSQNLELLKGLLAEMFQLDQAELDFGIYRIMNTKREEIVRFLDRDLLPQVCEAFQAYEAENRGAVETELAQAIEKAKELGADPETLPRVKELRAKLTQAVDVTALENEVYSHLYSFFRRYYQEGDFISLRRYKEGVYAIPYEGEEVKLHWANHDQYYIKTSEYLRDYAFKLPSGKRVHFKLFEADTDKDNNRGQNGNERRFILPLAEENGELVVRFDYRPHSDKAKQADLNAAAVDRILNQTTGFDDWRRELASLRPTEKNPNRTLLEKHLTDYTARNTFDYFIHKDLGGFLQRELDFYIKNEVMHLDDVESDTAPRVEQYLSKIKAIRRIAHKIIAFLAQIENFQKKLWLKKKFVVETQYCVTLDRLFAIEDEEARNWLLDQIIKNDAQREEWVNLCAIDELKGDLSTPGFSKPLNAEFLKTQPSLVVDTRHFDEDFKHHLLACFDDLDKQTDGLLIHSENFQALSLLLERYKKQVKCIDIDPPYNTGSDEFPYKDGYQASSWASMILDRAALARTAICSDGLFQIQIGDEENARVRILLETLFPERKNTVVVRRGIKNVQAQFTDISRLSLGHDVIHVYANSSSVRLPHLKHFHESEKPGKWDTFWRGTDRPSMRYELFGQHPEKGQWRWEEKRAKAAASNYDYYQKNEANRKSLDEWYTENLQAGVNLDFVRINEEGVVQYYVPPQAYRLISDNWLDIPAAGSFTDFPTEKHTELLQRVISWNTEPGDLVLDYFAGSGSTAHAAITLKDGKRKYVLVEMGCHFENVLLPRLKRATYASDWKDGKPVSRNSGVGHVFKYIRLESYEDSLNNLLLKRTGPQQVLLEMQSEFREDYMLRYMLDVESRESASLLNVDLFVDPFSYKLNFASGSAGETKPMIVDLMETFNYLIGLHVNTIDDVRGVRVVTGMNPQGERVLILWRKTKELDNDALDAWFCKQGYNTKDQEYDIIYVNGDSNLENLRKADQTWKVRLIEEEFRRLMFDVQDV
jgi:adenine-specific DNA-methyltransferase